ncbi:sec-independent protein translocase protein TatA [Streptomyces zhaozhouensis]|uniref:Sec-independent protein translocase protein TatA n=1 Tax=Streptomyces zhaozhouensis TaxID=1300267 RepID=A0A286DYF4_9ACTN|nr:Sec-independent protein translocase subunit TatA [Streptomyces zhaozhouensis]SOD63689.1 sec-independent protein translocase protein TatA [Streptomyces zhaozhouensis]
MGQIGLKELLLLALIVLVLFGAKRLPDLARSLGKSARILKSETSAMKSEGKQSQADAGTAQPEETPAPRTIQAAPGDVTSARPVDEPKPTSQQQG